MDHALRFDREGGAGLMDFPYEYNATVRIADGGDPRAIGGAVTVALCGHWEHDGPCRWPHHTATIPIGSGRRAVTTRFACSESEEAEVRGQIAAAVASRALTSPDGVQTTWTVETG
jgi:hypothetical protein